MAVRATLVAAHRLATDADSGGTSILSLVRLLFGVERQNFAAVDHARVVREGDDRLAGRARIGLDLARPPHLRVVVQVAQPRVTHWPLWLLPRRVLRQRRPAPLRLRVQPRQVKLLNRLQLLLRVASARSPRGVTYLVVKLAFNVPLGVLEELVDVFAEHALEVAILHALLRLTLVAHLLDLGLAVRILRRTALV